MDAIFHRLCMFSSSQRNRDCYHVKHPFRRKTRSSIHDRSSFGIPGSDRQHAGDCDCFRLDCYSDQLCGRFGKRHGYFNSYSNKNSDCFRHCPGSVFARQRQLGALCNVQCRGNMRSCFDSFPRRNWRSCGCDAGRSLGL